MMATAPVGIAPVLTPYTLGVLADTLERDHFAEKASALRKLQPFVGSVVERFFVPLPINGKRGTLLSRFNRLSRDFEPFRLYLNIRLFATLENREFLGFYEQTLFNILDSLMKTARDMDMGPELIAAAVRDYVKIVRAILESAGAPTLQGSEPTVDQLTNVVHCFRAATRFDYGLTAVFLVLERSIPKPSAVDTGILLSVCRKALVQFGQATSKIVAQEHMQRVLRELETPRIKIAVKGRGVRVLSSPTRKDTAASSSSETEKRWLARNKDLSARYGGQWIVLEKDELVANDPDYGKAREAATQRGIRRPFIIFVPLKEDGGFMGL